MIKMHRLEIKGFRSIEEACLDEIGQLSVLVGRNNSGKSNIFASIEIVFSFLKSGKLVQLSQTVGVQSDFNNIFQPIELAVTFHVYGIYRLEFFKEIERDKSDVYSEEDLSYIRICLSCARVESGAVVYVKSISISRSANFESDKNILSISTKALSEVVGKLVESEVLLRVSKEIGGLSSRLTAEDVKEMFRQVEVTGDSTSLLKISNEAKEHIRAGLHALLRGAKSSSDILEYFLLVASNLVKLSESKRSESLVHKIEVFGVAVSFIPSSVNNIIKRISNISVSHITDYRKPVGALEAKELVSLKLQRESKDVIRKIEEAARSVLGVELEVFASSAENGDAEVDVDEFLIKLNGAGIRSVMGLILEIELKRPKVLLVEEPELYLHPSLEMNLMRYLKSTSSYSQILLTTHSTNFVDMTTAKNLFLIKKEGATSVKKMEQNEYEMCVTRELGVKPSMLFMYDRVVFVEGPSDEMVLREWAGKLGVNLHRAGVGFVHMGGVHNFSYFAMEQTLGFFSKRNVKMWFVMDRDEKNASDISDILKKCDKTSRVIILNKRELENYFLIPRVVRQFVDVKLKLKGGAGTKEITESEILLKIESVANEMKMFAVEKRVVKQFGRPVYPVERKLLDSGEAVGVDAILAEIDNKGKELASLKEDIKSYYRHQELEVQKKWSDKLEIIPGDMLLDRVCKLYGVRFHKSSDSIRMAALLRPNEIDTEIKDILEEIARL